VRTKRSLLVGIDAYPHVRPLKGCVNDVRLVQGVLLERFGFGEPEMTVLLDGQATRAGILAALDDLIATTAPDDIVVFYYAGHGSQMTDREGDEPSGFDSTLMPFDTARGSGENRDITDDEIHLRLEALAGVTPYTTVIVDACHSGTITRDAFGEEVRAVEADRRPVSELPPSPLPPRSGRAPRAGASGWMPAEHTYVLLSGCRDEEESKEYRPVEGGGPHGAMTYFLCRQLRQAVPGTTYRDVFEPMAAQVTAYNRAQHPQMEGQADREVFGVTDLAPAAFVPVVSRAGATVILGAGLAQGLTAGSTYRVWGTGTKTPENGAEIADIEVTTVRPFDADANIVREVGENAVGAGARAFESAHAYGDTRLAVEIAPAAGADQTALAQAIERSGRLRVADRNGAARAYLLAPRTTVSASTPVPQAGALDTPKWAVVSATGDLLMKLKDPGDTATVVENLEKIARYRQVLAIDNPVPSSRLRNAVSLDLFRRGDDQPATQPDGGLPVFVEGEKITLRIVNRHQSDVYIALVVVEMDGAVSVVELDPTRQLKLRPNQTFEIKGDLPFPAGYPFVDLGDPLRGAEGVETFKLFVTERPVDFSGLSQSGLRAVPSPLELLLQGTVADTVTRAFRPEPVAAVDDWTTVSRTFVLKRVEASLTQTADRVAIGQATLHAPTLSGRVTAGEGPAGADLSPDLMTPALQQAFAVAGVRSRQTIEIADAQDIGARSVDSTVTVRLLSPPQDHGQMVMAVDESGVISWHFAEPEDDTRAGDAFSAGRTYVLPAAVPSDRASADTGSRGLIGLAAKKIFKELVFPLVDPVLGEVSAAMVGRFEGARFPYRMRAFGPDDYAGDEAAPIDRDGWSRLQRGRALLMVHGTFSRSHLAFGRLPKAYVEDLHRLYEGRVFAFDHPTLSADPRANVEWLAAQLPPDLDLTIDILCHSRGGLVSRLLTEQAAELGLDGRLRVGKVVMVGVPNAGTTLADSDHLGKVLDVFTNLLNVLPDNGVTEVMTLVVEVAKVAAVGAMGGLVGLKSMRPTGDFIRDLNAMDRSGVTQYFAVASNVTPTDPGLRQLAVTRGLNAILQGANDFIVPAAGVFAAKGPTGVPTGHRLLLEGTGAVTHTTYFSDARVREQVIGWLAAT
jgi:hypothetical protein